jgi:hypothetical protein
MIQYNFLKKFTELDLFIDLENIFNIEDIKLKDKLFLELKNSIVPEWKIKNPNLNPNSNSEILYKDNKSVPNINLLNNDFENYITNGLASTNQINEFDSEIIFDTEKIKMLKKLNDFGIQFDMRFNEDYQIKINSGEIVFPICCVGKNRSQYLFYYLKKLQGMTETNFEVGYPSSGDELSVMVEYLSNDNDNDNDNGKNKNKNKSNNKNVLSSFFPQYKKDNFSNTVGESLNITNPDGLFQVSRSVHVFDKILKIKQDYLTGDLKNFETHKYKENILDIFENDQNYLKIKFLFEKYFLLPNNLLKIINYNRDDSKKINKITFICGSDKSFYNICLCFNSLINKYPNIEFNSKLRIVYFGIKDIFQKSNIKQEDIDNFKHKIINGFDFDTK